MPRGRAAEFPWSSEGAAGCSSDAGVVRLPVPCAFSHWVLLVAQPQPPGPPPTAAALGAAEGPAGWRERFRRSCGRSATSPASRRRWSRSRAATWRSSPAPSTPLAPRRALQLDRGRQGSRREGALGKKAWDAADKAIAANADDVRGHYTAPWESGCTRKAWGIITALFAKAWKESSATAPDRAGLDKDYLDGAPQVCGGATSSSFPGPSATLARPPRC